LIGALVLFATACAGPRETARPIAPREARHAPAPAYFYQRAYDELSARYISALDVPTLAATGLSNLSKLDTRVSIRREDQRVLVLDGEAPIASFEAPRREDTQRWASLTAQAIETARGFSPTLRETANDRVYRTVLDALSRLDTYTRYDDPERARESRAARDGFGGIGVTLGFENGETRIDNVIGSSPAGRAGLRVGDRILSVDGRSIVGMGERDVIARLRGPVGTEVRIEVRRAPTEQRIEMRLFRSHIVPTTVVYRRDGDVAYIRVSGFNQRTTDALAETVRQAKAEIGPSIRGAVIDLRGNLGGLLDQAVGVSDLFLARGTIVSTRGRHRASQQSMTASSGDVGEDLPLVVLINGQSASASEIVAAALQDNGRAIVVGTTSFGKGSVQTLVEMPNDGELVITWARFHAPSGYPLADLGVMPAFCTSGRAESVAEALAAVRRGQITDARTMARWRAADHADTGLLKRLREICPPDSLNRDGDLEIAEALLRDTAVFARVLQSVHQTAQAK
jgi:carboxyl-terminal processing protease